MRPRTLFFLSLVAFLVLYVCYGLNRFALGVDFTDEGAYVAWPMRFLFGEKAFASELTTLLRPFEVYFTLPFQLHPGITLYEFRLLGWSFHLLAFALLSSYLFCLSTAPLQSLLLASVPLFVCHIFGLAPPAYNSVSSDFFLIALCLKGLADLAAAGRKLPLEIAGGLALFVATFAHPGLGVAAAVILGHEFLRHDLGRNLLRRRLTPSNAGILVFVACWVGFLLCLLGSGALASWLQRIALVRSFSANSLHGNPALFFFRLAAYPFTYSGLALVISLAAIITAVALHVFSRAGRSAYSGRAATLLAFMLTAALISTVSYEPKFLPTCFALVCLIVIGTLCLRFNELEHPASPTARYLLLMSGFGAVLYATFTYYFHAHRSWVSGILALPFAFSVGLTLLLKMKPAPSKPLRALMTAALVIALACVIQAHYQQICRDLGPPDLQTSFRIPKLRPIRSTEERVRAVEDLYAHLHPKLARGEPLLVFDDCPMLYYIFDAMPAYGLAWASRFAQSPAGLAQLNRELNSKPLPRYAIRTLVDVSIPIWSIAERTNYDNYPLNETVMANYELERTIFPFEIWRLKPAPSGEKTSPILISR